MAVAIGELHRPQTDGSLARKLEIAAPHEPLEPFSPFIDPYFEEESKILPPAKGRNENAVVVTVVGRRFDGFARDINGQQIVLITEFCKPTPGLDLKSFDSPISGNKEIMVFWEVSIEAARNIKFSSKAPPPSPIEQISRPSQSHRIRMTENLPSLDGPNYPTK